MTDSTSASQSVPLIVEAFPLPPVCWPTLDPAEINKALADLSVWVIWLFNRYNLDHRTVPECWRQHGDLIEELSALHGAWRAAYAETAHPGSPLDWHTNFAATRGRLSDWVARAGCRPGEHRIPFLPGLPSVGRDR